MEFVDPSLIVMILMVNNHYAGLKFDHIILAGSGSIGSVHLQ